MYPYFYRAVGAVLPCCYCTMGNRTPMNRAEYVNTKSMAWGTGEFEKDRADKGSTAPPMQQMPGMGQQMPGMMDMGKLKSDTQEIVNMFEQHHPDIINTLTCCGMSIGEARQTLSGIVEMTLIHHMMHQM